MSAWLPPGLWRLIGLRLRASGRDIWNRVKTPSGALTAVAALAFLAGWLVPRIWLAGSAPVSPETFAAIGPVGLLVMWCGQVAIRGGGEVLGFMPEEADQLFAAPFRPEDLIRYKVTLLLFAWTSGGVLLSPMAMFYAIHPLGGFLAVLLVLPFLQLSAMVGAMARQGGRRMAWLKIVFYLALVAGGVALATLEPDQGAEAWSAVTYAFEHPVGAVVLAPFIAGAGLLGASSTLEVLRHGAVLLVVDALLVLALVRLGRGAWLELAVEGAGKMGELVARYRSGSGVASLGGFWSVTVPRFGRWGGVGPVAWRRTVEIVRRPASLGALGGVALLVLGLGIFVPFAVPGSSSQVAAYAMLGAAVVWGMILVPGILRLDFRADLDRMDQLLVLPLPATAVFLGQILPMALLVTLGVWMLDGLVALWHPEVARAALVLAAVQPAFALLVVATENCVFLWLPVRMEAGEAALQSVGRNLFVSFLGWTVTGTGLVAASTAGVAAYLVTTSTLLGVLAATAPLLVMAAIAVALGAFRYARFDPSVHVPR